MSHGVCLLGSVALRQAADDNAPMQSQLLYGELFKFKERRKFWSRIQTNYDNFEGWVRNNQVNPLLEGELDKIDFKKTDYNRDLVSFVSEGKNGLIAVPLGAEINNCEIFQHTFEGTSKIEVENQKADFIETAFLYLNSPYLLGGKTPFGIDNSGFTQMVYKINGQKLFRTVEEQSNQGEVMSFIEECEPGDLAFFDDREGNINHVGIVLKDNYIIHAHGKVRIDRIDHTGIFNTEEKKYSHQLRVLKRIL
ncbi:C40 family peptidase [Croceivirga thetidis]|uniref:C40 family peptidase n=1 Tax=Croceivirga thetidis TaxID=2721623 RepID=A0ABX1GPY9_9FLAO|nr:C40 family peptidase [Croceivirga thetidis]NKI31967.1 C40 family peptidase [Croceivirga thetidis]